MKEIYLEVFSNVSEDGTCSVPLETAIVLFINEYCDRPPLLVTLVLSRDLSSRPHFNIILPKLPFEILDEGDTEIPANLFKYPVTVANGNTSCISGLCSVLRDIVRTVDEKHPLLGFKQGSLCACAESSVWTRFCEIDIIETVNDLFKGKDDVAFMTIPPNLQRFEVHMGKPVKAHNIQKHKQDLAREEGIITTNQKRTSDSRLDMIKDLDHKYSEGHKLTLADLVLLPCFHLIFQLIGNSKLIQHFRLTHEWYEGLLNDNRIKKSIKFLSAIERRKEIDFTIPQVPDKSLYKSEWKISKKNLYTKQDVIESSLGIIGKVSDSIRVSDRVFGCEIAFNWSSISPELRLEGCRFPKARMERKAHQLENMARAVLKISRENDRIVDFCSGSGYLGLLLAHSLPSCKIILLENKEESLSRAKEQAVKSKLSNLIFCQGNIDYFRGDFDIGVSLHACGTATDLVIEKCLEKKACFVCCPCCYGSIQSNHLVRYPRSMKYMESSLTLMDYLTLAHSADQTHDESNHKTDQGRRCMNVIDADRCLRAEEIGYRVHLSRMEPSFCTPKNNLLVGIPQDRPDY